MQVSEKASAIGNEVEEFRLRRTERANASARRLALRLMFGLDGEDVDRLGPDALRCLAIRMARRLERERLKGSRGHWSYDLNRHIALKKALDHVRARLNG